MQPTLCTKCNKNVAVIFITRIENGTTKNEGLCLKCAKELGIQPVDDMMKKMGISDDDLENLTAEMSDMMSNGGLMGMLTGHAEQSEEEGDESDETDSQTATFPFLNKLFGNSGGQLAPQQNGENERSREKSNAPKNGNNKKKKFLSAYCLDLTARARDGKLDRIVGRDVETERVVQILNRRQKNNPCLIGEPGVGKTAI
ncbi:MAG: ATP-dependent Clp protease ATP-binding subunit, partial [Oscillospiraceae bacterium]|nr:ATP-dependent Clp protease ATP-binding subunit [Oscillospiraceae bacterium]